MGYNDYCTAAESTKPENKDKKVVSNDAKAIIDLLEELRKEIFRSNRHG